MTGRMAAKNTDPTYQLDSMTRSGPRHRGGFHGRCFYSTSVTGDRYQVIAARFVTAFAAAGQPLAFLRMPEYYADASALPGGDDAGSVPAGDIPTTAPPPHLIFRAPEQIRLLKPGYNIVFVDEAPDIPPEQSGRGRHPFHDPLRMLSICDEIWVPSHAIRDALAGRVLADARVIPPPLAIARLDAITGRVRPA